MQTVNVLVVKDIVEEKAVWSAQCLEHDIAAQGATIEQALMELTKIITAEALILSQEGRTLDDLPKAPQWYWGEFHKASTIDARSNFPVMPSAEIPPAFMLPEFRELRVA